MAMKEEKNHLSLGLLSLDTFHLQLPTVGEDCGVLLLLLVSHAGRMENITSSQISSGALSVIPAFHRQVPFQPPPVHAG